MEGPNAGLCSQAARPEQRGRDPQAEEDCREDQCPGGQCAEADRRWHPRADRRAARTGAVGRESGRPAAGDVRAGARGGGARAGPAAVRRAADRRDCAASGPHRGDAHRRGQDADGHAACGAQRAAGQGRAHRHGQRLSGEVPIRMDGQAVPLPRAVGRPDRARPRRRRAAGGLQRRHHLRHEQRVRLRLPARQHGHLQGAHGAAAAELRHRRRGRLDLDRRGAHAADHLRPGGQVHQPVRAGEPVRRPRADRGQGGEGRRAGRRRRFPQG